MKYSLTLFFSLINLIVFSQRFYTISGYVKDKKTGEALIAATVIEKTLFNGVTTNGYGFYSLSLPVGQHTIVYSYMGYESISVDINLIENITKEISLNEQEVRLDAVTITAGNKKNSLVINEFNVERLTVKDIRQLPCVFGEADVIKVIQLQSGVKTIGDGSSGMFIRGGSSDQNLILIDEAPIYNPAHLFGLISVFNPDALNHVTLYKSNMPAQYGGRASSVIDCKMKEGNIYKYDFSAGINPFSAIFMANGPIVKEKAAFFVSARKSFIDLVFNPGSSMALVPAFYDVNIKVNTKLGAKDRLFISIYNGKDHLESLDGFYNKWGNTSGTIRWNHNIGSRLFSNVSFIISNYDNYMDFNEENRNYKWLTGLKDMNLKFDLSYYIVPKNIVKFGANSIYHKFIPGETIDRSQSIPRIQAFEHAIYVLNDLKPIKRLGLNYGLRLSIFQNTGDAIWYEYDDNYNPIILHTNKKKVYNNYYHLEPRVNINFIINPNNSLKVAYARNAQYMQVLQNNSLSYTSLETWFPANPNIKPLIADIISTGWFKNITDTYFFSVELYYKTYQNQIDYIDHARLLNNSFIEGETRNGTSRTYGAEFNIKKENGRLTGSMSYTYSRAFRKIEGINNNKEYNSLYDIPHDFRIITNYKLNQNWKFSSVWLYMSGRPVTLPVGFYFEGREIIPIYSERNASRFPAYHRLDVAATYSTKLMSEKSYWTIGLGVYNLYARKNPLGYSFENRADGVHVYQFSLFSIMPNLSVKFNF